MYLSLEAVTGVLEEVYGFSLTRVGLAFLCASCVSPIPALDYESV